MSDHHQKYRLLLIEDNPADMRLMLEAIRHAHLDETADATQCYNAEEAMAALARATASRQPYHLVLLDLNIPRTSGREILQQIRADHRYRHMPVYIFTNSDSPRDMKDCMALGADLYIQKPADFNQQIAFFSAIRHSLAIHHRLEKTYITTHISNGMRAA